MYGQRMQSGFTLTELMTAVLLGAVLTILAVPGFKDFSVNQNLRAAQYDLFNDLVYARSEAIKRNDTVVVQRTGANWATGWSISANGSTLRSHPILNSTVTEKTGPASFSFGRDGRLTIGSAITITLDDSAAKDSIAVRTISVDASGRLKSS